MNPNGKETRPIFLSALAAILIIFASCSSFEKTTRKIGQDLSGSRNFKKSLLCLPFENKSGFEKEKPQAIFLHHLTDQLEKRCPDLHIATFEKGFNYSDFALPSSSTPGQVDFLSLSERFRQKGYHILVAGTLMDISATVEKRGVLWFKEDRYIFKGHVEVSAIDTGSGTRILDEDFFYESEIDEKEFNTIRSGKETVSSRLRPALLAISQEAGKKLCEAIDTLPWFCYVKAVSGNKVILSCGKKSGLREGMVLNVFEKGKSFASSSGQRYLLKGEKTGQIKITGVSPDEAEAVPFSGGPFSDNSIITF